MKKHFSTSLSSSCILIMILAAFFFSCKENKTESKELSKPKLKDLPADMTYSYECLKTKSGKVGDFFEKADDLLNDAVTTNITVTDEEVSAFGGTFYAELKKDSSIRLDEKNPINAKLKTILADLLKARIQPSGIKYDIFLIDDDETLNAYTAGGKIFVTTAMLKACKTDDQLYSIIGHEIGHNEKGHIRLYIQQQKAAEKYLGEYGETVLTIKKLLTMSFNQKKELEADYYGLDLAWRLGYNICATKTFWDSLSVTEEHNMLEDMFRTHPYSDLRSKCLKQHIEKNFHQTCN